MSTHQVIYAISAIDNNCMDGVGLYHKGGWDGILWVDDNDTLDWRSSSLRFVNVNLGVAPVITSAFITGTCSRSDYSGANGVIRIRCQNSNTPLIFSTDDRPYAREYRDTFYDHNFPPYEPTRTIPVTSLVQDLVTCGYTYYGLPEHAMVFTFKAGQWGITDCSWRMICDGEARNPATLTINYRSKRVIST